jgi:hypothetical protein
MSVRGRQAADMKSPWVDKEHLAVPASVYVALFSSARHRQLLAMRRSLIKFILNSETENSVLCLGLCKPYAPLNFEDNMAECGMGFGAKATIALIGCNYLK